MKYFKDNQNNIFAYDDEQIKQGYGKKLTPISIEDVNFINEQKYIALTQTLEYKLQEAKSYLNSTDFKMLPDYILKNGEILEDIITKRNELREFIRSNKEN